MATEAEAFEAGLDPVVVRPKRTATWNLVRSGTTAASAYAVHRPDRRWFVSVDAWDEHAYGPLVNAMIADLNQDLHTRIDGADTTSLELWTRYGFEPDRREIEFLISPDPQRTGLAHCPSPKGLTLLRADEVEETALRELDDQLRDEVPGTEGWINDPAEFHDYTYDEKRFDPATYLVAVDDDQQQFAGLVRIWANGTRSRLGLIAVTRPYRRRGLARALLASAFRPLHERGVVEVLTEVDALNIASLKLLASINAVETGARWCCAVASAAHQFESVLRGRDSQHSPRKHRRGTGTRRATGTLSPQAEGVERDASTALTLVSALGDYSLMEGCCADGGG